MIKVYLTSVFLIATFISPNILALDVRAQGLFNGAALLTIDGRQQLIKVGKRSSEGVLLVEANSKNAIIEIEGIRKTLTLSRHISGRYSEAAKTELAIRRNDANQYITYANINGIRTQVLVDTGANTVAMSSAHARLLGINYLKGKPGRVRTASGDANAYSTILRSIDLSGIKVSGVEAFIIEGNFPEIILLGMTYLNHVDMREQSGILYIQSRY